MSIFNLFRDWTAVEPLCRGCAFAHIERSFFGEDWIFCNSGVAMRPLRYRVCECTGYVNCEAAKPSKITGFRLKTS